MKKNTYIDKWIKKHLNKHFCRCGCGKVIEINKWHHFPSTGIPNYIKSHQSKGRKLSKLTRKKMSEAAKKRTGDRAPNYKGRDKWVKKHQGKHFCKVCGEIIRIKKFHYSWGIPKHHPACTKPRLGKRLYNNCKICSMPRILHKDGSALCKEHHRIMSRIYIYLYKKNIRVKNIPDDLIKTFIKNYETKDLINRTKARRAK